MVNKITLSPEEQQANGIWIDTDIFTSRKVAKKDGEIIGEVEFVE